MHHALHLAHLLLLLWTLHHPRVLGGEGCMWGEFSAFTNVLQNTWPKAAVVGERFWSPADARDVSQMSYRLSFFTCELMRRGLPASVVTGPGYCDWQ